MYHIHLYFLIFYFLLQLLTMLTSPYLPGYRSKPQPKAPTKRKHEESDLQLSFCKYVRLQYPQLDFIRHEREQKRSQFMGQLMGKYNSLGGIADWECLDAFGEYHGLYLEFKKPGEKWLNKYGQVKTDYAHQYNFHCTMWRKNRCAYFCNDLNDAMAIMAAYVSGQPLPQQLYPYTEEDEKKFMCK